MDQRRECPVKLGNVDKT
ncbi:unnamed protein product [Acanthoscelides obtectus]|uniref:Uncharacterized protein n=1 Tax=Acanthoscelides obtectus TaxID=200917 RepID=A0A9P0NRB2_ACAOB|nr:unnamed protein product [Acanthoscelides obtectus]CAK1634614.1 hypothetical protein AOBTE_LOCUS8834 [Acanthoscelides obtectus]